MKIRDYQLDDKSALITLTIRAWKPVFAGLQQYMSDDIYKIFVPDWQQEQLRSISQVCDAEDVEVIVAEENEKIIGFAAVKLHPDDFLGEIYMIGVDPDHQRKGLGSALTDASLKIIKRSGLSLAMVETGGDPGHEPARKTYEKMGFELLPVARYLKKI